MLMRLPSLLSLPKRSLALALCLLTLLPQIHAQSYVPSSCSFSNSVYVDGQVMYVQSGSNNSDIENQAMLGQAFSIDLTTSWKVANPPYKNMGNGYISGPVANTLSRNHKDWFIMINKTAYNFNVDDSSWTSVKYDLDFSEGWHIRGVTDPATGKMYFPHGRLDYVTQQRSMLVYDESTKDFGSIPLPQPLLALRMIGTTWSDNLGSIVMFGGYNIDTNTTRGDMYAFHPVKGWTNLNTTGDVPSSRRNPCLVQVQGGSKLVLFGGQADRTYAYVAGTTLDDIYTLDLNTFAWTRGNDAGLAGARVAHVCAASGDHVIVWGGYSTIPFGILNDTIVYNLKTARWVDEYTPDSKGSGKKGAVIGGTIAAVVIVVGAIGALFWRRRKQHQQDLSKLSNPTSPMGTVPAEPLAQTSPIQEHVQQVSPQPQVQPSPYYPPQQQVFATADYQQQQQVPFHSQPVGTYYSAAPVTSGSVYAVPQNTSAPVGYVQPVVSYVQTPAQYPVTSS